MLTYFTGEQNPSYCGGAICRLKGIVNFY